MSDPGTRSEGAGAERWAAIETAFGEASSLGTERRASFLTALGRDDPALATEVRSLLAAGDPASDPWWLDEPIVTLPASEPPLERIGPYQLVRPLGHGGMADVWLAVREGAEFRQHVALKIIRSGLESAELMAAFRAERQILASLNHPNIAHLLDVGETPEGRPYLALEFVEGLPLTEYCDQHGLGVDARLRLFRTVCDAVRFAHQNLIVHQDLKPSNILVTAGGTPKLLDFGIAKVLAPEAARRSGALHLPAATPDQALTPEFAAPEQLEGGTTTTASDVYALGVVLYQLLTSRLPYRARGHGRRALLQTIRDAPPPAPSAVTRGPLERRLAGDLDAIVLRAMAPTVHERYASVEQLSADIDRSLAFQPISARPHSPAYVARRFVRRNRIAMAIGGVALVMLGMFVMTVMRQSAAIRERSAQADRERAHAVAVSSLLQDLFRGAGPTEARGSSISVRELLDRGAARIERELASQPATHAELLIVMSEIYQDLGLYQRGEELSARAITVLRGRHVPDDSALAASQVAHGKALHYLDSTSRAIAAYDSALGIRRRLGDTASAVVAQILAYKGSALQDRGDSSAERMYRTAIAIERSRDAGNKGDAAGADTTLAFALSNLGVLLRRRGDLADAEAAHREVLAIRRRALGEDHPETIRTLNNLAIVIGARGDLATAESLLVDVLARWRRVLGPDHPTVAIALNNLGGLYLRRHEPARAVPMYTEALAIRRARLSATSSEVATSVTNLAIALEATGDRAGAAQRYREAIAIRTTQSGPNDSTVVELEQALARVSGPAAR